MPHSVRPAISVCTKLRHRLDTCESHPPANISSKPHGRATAVSKLNSYLVWVVKNLPQLHRIVVFRVIVLLPFFLYRHVGGEYDRRLRNGGTEASKMKRTETKTNIQSTSCPSHFKKSDTARWGSYEVIIASRLVTKLLRWIKHPAEQNVHPYAC